MKQKLTYEQQMLKKQERKEMLGLILIFATAFVILAGFTTVEIYVWVKYGNLPITEIPSWAILFMFGGNGK